MEVIDKHKHPVDSILIILSKLLERISYYGLKGVFILFLLNSFLKTNEKDANIYYGIFVTSFFISNILGALIGDLFLGSKKSILLGGIINGIGCFCLCFESNLSVIVGVFLIVFGNGLYSPNLIAGFGKTYYQKFKILDSGISFYFFGINIGAFLGGLLITFFALNNGFTLAFIIVGSIMLLSIIPIYFIKTENLNKINQTNRNSKPFLIILFICIAALLTQPFLALFDYIITPIRYNIWGENFNSIWNIIFYDNGLILSFVLMLGLAFFWTFKHTTTFSKLIISLIFGILSFIPLYFSSYLNHSLIIVLSIIFSTISTVFFSPVFLSIFIKHCSFKYLAVCFSFSFWIYYFINLLSAKVLEYFSSNTFLGLTIGISVMFVLLLSTFLLKNKIEDV